MGATLRDLEAADIPACAAMVCDSEIGRRYGFTVEAMAATLGKALASQASGAGDEVFVAADPGRGPVLGFAWIHRSGAFASAPYLRLIAVDPQARGSGIGALLLGEFERRGAPSGRPCLLLVSDFNAPARAFYARQGYEEVGLLPGFARPDIGEVIMMKAPGRA